MKATLIFDSVNDLLFYKWDENFINRMKSFNGQDNGENVTDSNSVSQLLSPIITSQRVMAAQFGNTYSSVQCKDNTSIVFDEWLDHVFVIITEDDVDDAHRELLDCKTLVQHICGQNINLLQSPIYQDWLSNLLECRTKGDNIPGANGFIGESGATVAALNALKAASKDIKVSHSHYHLMLFVGDKMLALYSSRGCEDVTPPDLILLSIQCVAAQEYWKELSSSESNRLPWLSQENSAIVQLCAGAGNVPCAPHSLHVAELAPRITLAVVVDMDLREVGVATYMANQVLANLRRLLLQRNLDLLPNTLDGLEAALKKTKTHFPQTTEALRKSKHSALCARLSTRMLELRKSCTTTTPLTPETTATAMHTALDAVVDLLKPDIPSLKVDQTVEHLRKMLAPYVDFLRVKAMRYFSMESADSEVTSITVHKYVGEFPGLVHFIYVDRTAGRSLAPDMADCADMLSPNTIRAIVSRSFMVSREGYCGATWRRGALHACAVWWWERGAALRPARAPHPAAVRALPPPGDILGSFYRQLTELAFPNDSQGVSMKELICVHLGLLPASTAVQQARRLAHTVHELGDHPAAADLL